MGKAKHFWRCESNPSCYFHINHKMVLHAPIHLLKNDIVHTCISFLKLQCLLKLWLKKNKQKKSPKIFKKGCVCHELSVSIWYYWWDMTLTRVSSPIAQLLGVPCAKFLMSKEHCTLLFLCTLLQVCTPSSEHAPAMWHCAHHSYTHWHKMFHPSLSLIKRHTKHWSLSLKF